MDKYAKSRPTLIAVIAKFDFLCAGIIVLALIFVSCTFLFKLPTLSFFDSLLKLIPGLAMVIAFSTNLWYAPIPAGLALIFTGLGFSLWRGFRWTLLIHLLMFVGGAVYFYTTPAPGDRSFDVGFVICAAMGTVLIVELAAVATRTRLNRLAVVGLLIVTPTASVLAWNNTLHIRYIDTYAAQWSPDGKRISYFSNAQIYLVDSDGSHDHAILDPSQSSQHQSYYNPKRLWSPDGQAIAAITFSGNAPTIFVIHSSDWTPQPIATTLNSDAPGVAWSPDGKRIAFVKADKIPMLAVVNRDGSGLQTLIEIGDSSGFVFEWSPDGNTILFRRGDELDLINPDGTNRRTLLTLRDDGIHADFLYDPAWSPDSKKIVFTYDLAIWTVDVKSENRTRLVPGLLPKWSPDGSQIYFMWFVDDKALTKQYDLYTMAADGTNVQRILSNLTNGSYDISPDGTQIVYQRKPALFVSNVNGSGEHRLVLHQEH